MKNNQVFIYTFHPYFQQGCETMTFVVDSIKKIKDLRLKSWSYSRQCLDNDLQDNLSEIDYWGFQETIIRTSIVNDNNGKPHYTNQLVVHEKEYNMGTMDKWKESIEAPIPTTGTLYGEEEEYIECNNIPVGYMECPFAIYKNQIRPIELFDFDTQNFKC